MRLKEVKSLHEVEVILHVKIGIPEDKRITVGNIITAVKYLEIEPKIAEQIIQIIDEKEVEKIVEPNTADAAVNNDISELGHLAEVQ